MPYNVTHVNRPSYPAIILSVILFISASTVKAVAHSTHSPVVKQHESATSGVVATAHSLCGIRYRFGGASRSGFDCSGFVRYVLSNSGGVDLPRTATDQYYHGQAVARKDLKPGDLVFFANTYRRGISHVGIYVGNGNFIHASNPRSGVEETSLNEPYYVEHYAGARRVLYANMLATGRDGRW